MAKLKITKKTGYVDTPIPKKCGTCEYLKDQRICTNDEVQEDPEVPEDGDGNKIVNPQNGCCDKWEPTDSGKSLGARLISIG